jgi:hypothetical protein
MLLGCGGGGGGRLVVWKVRVDVDVVILRW